VIPKESEKITAPDANDVTPAGVITKEFEKIIAPKDNQPVPADVNIPY
jgi:hypothetical protein